MVSISIYIDWSKQLGVQTHACKVLMKSINNYFIDSGISLTVYKCRAIDADIYDISSIT